MGPRRFGIRTNFGFGFSQKVFGFERYPETRNGFGIVNCRLGPRDYYAAPAGETEHAHPGSIFPLHKVIGPAVPTIAKQHRWI